MSEDQPRRLSRRVIYENPWLNLYVDSVELPHGKIVPEHHVIDFHKQAVAAVVERAGGDILLIQAYRYTTGSIGWEIPAGGIEPGESILEAARREVREESGYDSIDHHLIYTFNPMSGTSNKVFHVVSCRATAELGDFDRDEVKEVGWFSLGRIRQMIRDKAIHDGYSLCGLLLRLCELDCA